MFTTDGKTMKTGARLVLGPDTDRLDSWKEIAVYVGREVRTAQRWERREGLPVQRHFHGKASSVWAFKHEISAWLHSRNRVANEPGPEEACSKPAAQSLNPARMQAKSRSWMQNAAAGVGSLDLLQGEHRIRLYFYVQLRGERDAIAPRNSVPRSRGVN
jgi:hypothetical protein